MADIEVPQCSRFELMVEFPDQIDYYDQVIVEVYTSSTARVKFAKELTQREYKSIILGDTAFKLKVLIDGEMTSKMFGRLFYEVKAYKDRKLISGKEIPALIKTNVIITELASKYDL